MSGIFISYRRGDSGPYAGRLYDSLRREFPDNRVFMDIDTIAPGDDFLEEIDKVLSVSKIVVAVIGPRWEDAADKVGRRRLDNQDDFVVHELGMALEAGVRVIPVLVGDAGMPTSEVLPLRLKPLARRQAIEISDTRFTFDTVRLCTAIKKVLSSSDERAKFRSVPPISADRMPPADAGNMPSASAAKTPPASAGQIPPISAYQIPPANAGNTPSASATKTSPASAAQISPISVSRTVLTSTDPPLGTTRGVRNEPEHGFWHSALLSVLWLNYLVMIFLLILTYSAALRGEALMSLIYISIVAVAGFLLNRMVLRYKKWARNGWMLLQIGVVPLLLVAFSMSVFGSFIAASSIALALTASFFMFTDPAKHYFDLNSPPSRG